MRGFYRGVSWTQNGSKGKGAEKYARHRVDVVAVCTLIWCWRCAGWASENRIGIRLRDFCKPGDPRLSCQQRRWEQGYRLGRKFENGKQGAYVQGRREPIIWGEFQSLCDLHDEVTFMAQGGLWHKMEKDWVVIQNEGPDLIDEMNEANMLYNENKRAFALREHEFGGHGNVRAR